MGSALARDQQIQVGVFQIESLTHVKIRKRTAKQIDAVAQMQFVPDQIFESTFFAGFQQQRRKHIADGL